MKLEIIVRTPPINVIKKIWHAPSEREVYIDGKQMPKPLADIFLLGLDLATEQYAQSLLKEMNDYISKEIK